MVRKALLPVGSQQDSWHLLARLLGAPDPERTAPPGRARLKAPLSFHFLSAGHDSAHAVCVTGRLNRATTWVPLEKTQSIRRVQGPLQRPLGLATVHVDVAGKRTRAEFRDREVEEADQLVAELTALSRSARQRTPQPLPAPRRRRRTRQAGTPTRPAATSSATGTRAAGPSTWPTAGGEARTRLRPRREAHREIARWSGSPSCRRASWSASTSYSGIRLCHSRRATRSSRRARCEPRQR